MEKKVEIYTSPTCHFCTELKDFLTKHKVEYVEYDVTESEERRTELAERSSQLGVPVVFIDGETMIVGFDRERLMETLDLSADA